MTALIDATLLAVSLAALVAGVLALADSLMADWRRRPAPKITRAVWP